MDMKPIVEVDTITCEFEIDLNNRDRQLEELMENNLVFKLDSLDLIVQIDGDGGDTSGREGDFWIAVWIYSQILNDDKILKDALPTGIMSITRFANVLNLLEVKPGIWQRHPVQYPENHEYSFSRDQTIPLIIAMGLWEQKEPLSRIISAYIKRGFRAQNKTDLMGPNVWGISIRALKKWYLYPILWFTDSFMILSSAIRVMLSWLAERNEQKVKDDCGDDINLCMELLQSRFVYPTPLSAIARWIYILFSPTHGHTSRASYAFQIYFRRESNANPFDKLYKPIIWHYLT